MWPRKSNSGTRDPEAEGCDTGEETEKVEGRLQRGNTQAHSALEYKRSAKRHKRGCVQERRGYRTAPRRSCCTAFTALVPEFKDPGDCDTVPNCHSHKSCTGCIVSNAMLPGVCDHSVSCLGLSVGLVSGSVDYMAHTMWSSSVCFAFPFSSCRQVGSRGEVSRTPLSLVIKVDPARFQILCESCLVLDGSVQGSQGFFACAMSSLPTALTLFKCLGRRTDLSHQ